MRTPLFSCKSQSIKSKTKERILSKQQDPWQNQGSPFFGGGGSRTPVLTAHPQASTGLDPAGRSQLESTVGQFSSNPDLKCPYGLQSSTKGKPKGFTGFRVMGTASVTLSVLATIKQRERILLRRGRNRLLSLQLIFFASFTSWRLACNRWAELRQSKPIHPLLDLYWY